jgi:hypothetical protein
MDDYEKYRAHVQRELERYKEGQVKVLSHSGKSEVVCKERYLGTHLSHALDEYENLKARYDAADAVVCKLDDMLKGYINSGLLPISIPARDMASMRSIIRQYQQGEGMTVLAERCVCGHTIKLGVCQQGEGCLYTCASCRPDRNIPSPINGLSKEERAYRRGAVQAVQYLQVLLDGTSSPDEVHGVISAWQQALTKYRGDPRYDLLGTYLDTVIKLEGA